MACIDKCSESLKLVIRALLQAGAAVYFVGGCVRDDVLGQEMKDFDIEVFHLSRQQLVACLSQFGHCDYMGQSFGIYKLSHLPEADFALPRSERKNGTGHQGFEMTIDPDLSIENAALRRDFTMNALYQQAWDGQLIDPYHGLEDIRQGLIRVVDGHTFVEDPLRVWRLGQFLSRLDFQVDPQAVTLCRQMVQKAEFATLSPERVVGEYQKLLLGQKPSKGLRFLFEVGALPDTLTELSQVHQRPDFHPEGSVWEHTLMVVDEAAKVQDKTSWPLGFMWSALLHDLGKKVTTDDQGHAYGHESIGAQMAVTWLTSLQKNKALNRYVAVMIENHMKLMIYANNGARDKTFLRLLRKLDGKTTLNDLYYLTQSDLLGCGMARPDALASLHKFLQDKVTRLGDQPPQPLVSGKDLLAAGFQAGPMMKTYLEQAYDLQLGGMPKAAIIETLRRGNSNGTREHRCQRGKSQ